MAGAPHLRQDIEFERLFDLSVDPQAIIAFDGAFRRVNAAFSNLAGYPKATLLSRSALDILHPDDAQAARAALAMLGRADDLVGFEARVMCADGSVRWVEWNARSMQERGVVYSVGRDITERRRVEAQSREAQRLLEARAGELAVLAEEQAALGRIATVVAEGASPSVVLDAVAGEMERSLGVEGTLLLRHEPNGEVCEVASRGWRPRDVRLGTRVDREGQSVDAPIVVAGRPWGIFGAQWPGERSPPADIEERMSKFAQLLGTAIANTESRAEVQRLAGSQAALRRVATLVADQASQEEILSAIAAEIGPLIGIEETRLVRFVDDRTAVTVAGAGSSDEFPVGEHIPAGPGAGTPVARVLATGSSVWFDAETVGDGPVAATLRRMGVRSGVCAPIYVEGRLWGSINTGSPRDRLPPDAESRLVQFTDLLATAIANTESRMEVERLAHAQAALRRVATLVAENPESDELFSAVAREVAGVMDVRGVIVDRFEPDGSQTTLASAYDLELEGGMTGDAARAAGVGCGCAAPIIVDGRLWGQMCVFSSAGTVLPAGTEDQLADFVKLVATAISNFEARWALRAVAEEQAQLAEGQAALRRVATLVARESSPGVVFAAVAEEVGRFLGVESTSMLRFGDGTITLVASWGELPAGVPIGTRFPMEGDNISARVLRTGAPARIDRYTGATGAIATGGRAAGVLSAAGAPIVVNGRLWGAMVAAAKRPLPDETEPRMVEFTELLATAIANIDARSELTASRARIVAAADEERRRVVRDLHDGAQQRLVHTVITLKIAQQALHPDGGDGVSLVSRALEHAQSATEELRELVHGILPAALTTGGLQAGVEGLAARMPVPVTVTVPAERFSAQVEATAYFVVAEALTNVAKHARATSASVAARVRHAMLELEVRDDGVGGARAHGSGLQGLADRLGAVEGRLDVTSPACGGTLITAAIPIPPA